MRDSLPTPLAVLAWSRISGRWPIRKAEIWEQSSVYLSGYGAISKTSDDVRLKAYRPDRPSNNLKVKRLTLLHGERIHRHKVRLGQFHLALRQ